MASIVNAIKDMKAKALTVPGIVYAAMFNNQVVMVKDGKTFSFPRPAILIEIQSPTDGMPTLGGLITVNEIVWRLSIVHEQLNAVYDGNAGTGMDENLDVFTLRDLVKTTFSGFAPAQCSQLMYSGESLDYDHDNIYVCGISFKCSYVDTKGSPLDPDSTQWVTGQLTEINLNLFDQWLPNKNYVANRHAAIYEGEVYLCAVSNTDEEFTLAKWTKIAPWIPATTYTANVDYAAYENHVYKCAVDNTDTDFNINNWTLVV